jgi:hypothetical protein
MLKNIIETIRQKQQDLATEVDLDSPTYRMVMGNKIRAEEDIQGLKLDYRDLLMKKMIVALSTGSSVDELASVSSDKYGMAVLDAEKIISDTMKKIQVKEFIQKDFTPSTFKTLRDNLNETLREKKLDSDLDLVYNSHKHNVFVESEQHLYNILLETVESDMSSLVFIEDILNQATEVAIEEGFDGTGVFPVFVICKNENLAKNINNNLESTLISAGDSSLNGKGVVKIEKMTDTNIEKAMLKLKSQTKKKGVRHENE